LILLAVVVFTFQGLTLLHALSLDFQEDDAYITLRYARNLVAGHGPVWNPGEHVEGYTSFLWMLLLAGILRAGLDVVPTIHLLGLLFLALALLEVFRLTRVVGSDLPEGRRNAIAALAVLLVSILHPYYRWALSGLEMPLAVWIFLWGARRTIVASNGARGAFTTGILWGIATLVRPEGFAFIAVSAAYLAIQRRRCMGGRCATALLAGAALVILPHLAWRLSYYHALVPNTFLVKTGPPWQAIPRGITYLRRAYSLLGMHVALPVVAATIAFRIARRREIGPVWPSIYLLSLFLTISLYYIGIGGDFMGERLLLLVAGIPWIIAADAAGRLAGAGRLSAVRTRTVLVAGVVCVVIAGAVYRQYGIRREFLDTEGYRDTRVASWTLLGRWLNANAPDGAVLATSACGAIPCFSGLRSVDALGLNNAHIARAPSPGFGKGYPGHEKKDVGYVLSQHPDLIAEWLDNERGESTWLFDLSHHEEFVSNYRLVSALPVPLKAGKPPILFLGSKEYKAQDLYRKGHGYCYGIFARNDVPWPFRDYFDPCGAPPSDCLGFRVEIDARSFSGSCWSAGGKEPARISWSVPEEALKERYGSGEYEAILAVSRESDAIRARVAADGIRTTAATFVPASRHCEFASLVVPFCLSRCESLVVAVDADPGVPVRIYGLTLRRRAN
jgi:arabinofuranosyltransferase